MSDDLREEIARALYEHDPGWEPEPWEKTNARMRAAYRVSADAILPIIERVRDEARAIERARCVGVVEIVLSHGDHAKYCPARSQTCECGYDEYAEILQAMRRDSPTGEPQ